MILLEYPSLQRKLTLHWHTAADYTADTVNEGATNLRNAGKYIRELTRPGISEDLNFQHHRRSRLHFTCLFTYLQYGDVRFEEGKTGAIGQ